MAAAGAPPRNVRLLGWFNFFLDFRLYGPIAILYYAQVSGSFALGMSIFSLTMLTSSLLEVPTGVWSDRVGRKQTLVAGAVASTLGMIFYALGSHYALLALGAALEGLARALFSGNNDALLHDTLTEHNLSEAYAEHLGKVSAMFQVALAAAALLGSLLSAVSFQLVYGLSVIPQALNIGISLQIQEPRRHRAHAEPHLGGHLRQAWRGIIHNPRLTNLSLGSILGFALGESAWQFHNAFVALLWPVWALGIAQFIGNLTAASGFYFAGGLIRRFGEKRLLFSSYLLSDTTTLLLTLFPSVLSPALMSVVSSFFFGVNGVGVNSLMQREFTPEQRATMASITALGGSLAFALASFLLGALADRIGALGAFAVITVLGYLPAFFYWRALRHSSIKAL